MHRMLNTAPLDDILQTASSGCGKEEEGSGNEIIITRTFFCQFKLSLVDCIQLLSLLVKKGNWNYEYETFQLLIHL